MSYTPTTWKAGDTVTSEKLNKIEQGIANYNILEVHHIDSDDPQYISILDKTWQEIHDAMPFVYIDDTRNGISAQTRTLVAKVTDDGNNGAWRYQVFTNTENSTEFATATPDGYPGVYDYD